MEEVLKVIFDTTIIDAGVKSATQKSITLGAILAPTFFVINALWNFATTTITNLGTRPKLFNKVDLIRAGILMLILSAGYDSLFGTVAKLGEALGRYSIDSSAKIIAGKEKISEIVDKEIQKDADSGSEEASASTDDKKDEGISIWNFIRGGVNLLIFNLFSGGTLALMTIIRTVVVGLAIMLTKILYAIGPVVIAFSILPIFKDKLSLWFGIYVCCLCVPFTCNLLDTIYFSIIGEGLKGEAIVNPITLSAFNIVYLITYCLVFWITSFYAGSSSAGKFLSTGVSAATMMLNQLTGAGGGAGGASEKQSGGNIIEDTAGATQSAK